MMGARGTVASEQSLILPRSGTIREEGWSNSTMGQMQIVRT